MSFQHSGYVRLYHVSFFVLIVVALAVMPIKHVVYHVAKSRVADIMEQGSNLLWQRRSQPPDQQHHPHRMLIARHRAGNTDEGAHAMLQHAFQAAHCGCLQQVQEHRFVNSHSSVHNIFINHLLHLVSILACQRVSLSLFQLKSNNADCLIC